MPFTLAKIEGGEVKVNGRAASAAVVVIAAIIAIIPPTVNSVLDMAFKSRTQPSTIALERAKLDLERRKVSAELYREALVSTDAAQRHRMLHFLIMANLLDENNNVSEMPPEEIPHWPAPSTSSP